MEGSSSSSQSFNPLWNQFRGDPRVAWLLNTRLGQYLQQHPVYGLTVLLFSAMAALPVGLFVIFALVTLVMSAVGFVFFEVFLLVVAGLTLLFTLSGLAAFSVVASFIFSTIYMISTNIYRGYYQQGTTQSKRDEAERENPQS